jgi:hypothetical protein
MARKILCHQISSGNNFDYSVPTGSPTNTLPPNVPVERDDFPEQAGGGKFDIGGDDVVVRRIEFTPDAGTTWSVKLLDSGDNVVQEIARNDQDEDDNPVFSSKPISACCRVSVGDGFRISITSEGAVGAISAEIEYEDGL